MGTDSLAGGDADDPDGVPRPDKAGRRGGRDGEQPGERDDYHNQNSGEPVPGLG